jgi:predicted negative regulator of RcsB-dependent stress response
MVILVILLNTLISLILLYVAWRVWQLKQQLAYIADRLTAYQSCTHAALKKAPENIYLSQQNIYNLRQRNQALQMQIQQVRQIISLLLLGRQIWQRYFPKLKLTSGKRTVAK